MRKAGVGCDFIDIRGLREGDGKKYQVIYVPYMMAMSKEEAELLCGYAKAGGTILCDALTAFSQPNGDPFRVQPGAGMDEALGLHTQTFEVVGEGRGNEPILDANGQPTAMRCTYTLQPVQTSTAKTLFNDYKGRPLITANDFGKGHALWSGTLFGMMALPHNTDPACYEAMASVLKPYIQPARWTLDATPTGAIVCRRLSSKQGDIFVLLNESWTQQASFKLNTGSKGKPSELLWPDNPSWKEAGSGIIEGALEPFAARVIYCPAK